MLIDSHCHLDLLDLTKYDGHLSNAIVAAQAAGVERMLCVGICVNSFQSMLQTIKNYSHIYASVGHHPNEPDFHFPLKKILIDYANNPKVIAIGETGLDYYRSQGDLEFQRERFRIHIQVARLLNKPLIIHTRAASSDTLKIMKEEGADQVGGVIHCFTESLDFANKALDLNFFISFSGILTYKNAEDLRTVAKHMPIDRILIETDAPYLSPVPNRGKPNEPAYVKFVAEKLAEILNIPIETIAKKTTENFMKLFRIQ